MQGSVPKGEKNGGSTVRVLGGGKKTRKIIRKSELVRNNGRRVPNWR